MADHAVERPARYRSSQLGHLQAWRDSRASDKNGTIPIVNQTAAHRHLPDWPTTVPKNSGGRVERTGDPKSRTLPPRSVQPPHGTWQRLGLPIRPVNAIGCFLDSAWSRYHLNRILPETSRKPFQRTFFLGLFRVPHSLFSHSAFAATLLHRKRSRSRTSEPLIIHGLYFDCRSVVCSGSHYIFSRRTTGPITAFLRLFASIRNSPEITVPPRMAWKTPRCFAFGALSRIRGLATPSVGENTVGENRMNRAVICCPILISGSPS